MTPVEESFFRQRRNLIATALLVTFLNVAAGELKKLNFLGNEIEFSNPNSIPLALGLALTYFLIRYVQYAHDIEDKGFKKRFYARVAKYLAPYLMKREFRNPKSLLARQYKPETLSQIKVDNFVMFDEAMPPNTAAISFVGKGGGIVVDENELKVSNAELFVPFVRAAMYIAIRTRLVTDFVLPLLIATVAYATYYLPLRIAISKWL